MGPDYLNTAPAHVHWQRITNEHWPPAEVARSLKDVPGERQIDIVARLVFEVDGEQHVQGRAVRWTKHHVCVWTSDGRLQVPYVWLAPSDVRRAE